MTLRLLTPNLDRMPEYVAALEKGWSPNNERDISGEQIELYRRKPADFLDELTRQDGTIVTGDGLVVPSLPSRVFWMDDGSVCGYLSLRYRPGTDMLPPHCHGHIGYAVVPWRRRRGYATRALALALPEAREVGLSRLNITCYEDNEPSRRVIEANGGVFERSDRAENGKIRLSFWIDLSAA